MENFPYIGLISWIIFQDMMIRSYYHGKQKKIQTRSPPKAHGPGPPGTSLSSLRLPHRGGLLRLDRSLHQILRLSKALPIKLKIKYHVPGIYDSGTAGQNTPNILKTKAAQPFRSGGLDG